MMPLDEIWYWLIILLPLAGAMITGAMALVGVGRGAHWPVLAALAGACAIALVNGAAFICNPAIDVSSAGRPWIFLDGAWAFFNLHVDGLTAVMLVVVTVVSFLVLVYSRGYMADDPGYARFFAEMSLFVAAMCTLVLAGNFLMLYLGWEGVGLCSFLLIGFWYRRPAAAQAAVKAFVVTRIGDTGFTVGILLLFLSFGTLDYGPIFEQSASLSPVLAVAIPLLLLAGAVGKSAQIPLYVWLPDAMEGPSPTSALIHAATMVTAGVYLVVRAGPLFAQSVFAMNLVAAIGAVTALYAATIALAQFDLKRILAYSTISQIGYMFLAVGIFAPAAGIFHLATHAFFKALLFLAAGVVMHAMAGVIDLRRIGGLRKHLPVTYWSFLIAALALSGVFPFAGYWSKDPIITAAWQRWPVLGAMAWLTTLLTALYIFRVFFLTFHGPEKLPDETNGHVHQPGAWMHVPIAILAIGSAGLGFALGWPPEHGLIDRLLEPALPWAVHTPPESHLIFAVLNTVAVLVMIVLAWRLFRPARVEKPVRPGTVFSLLNHKYYVDELYDALAVAPARTLAEVCNETDDSLIDGILHGLAAIPGRIAEILRPLQRGPVQVYALGVLVLLTIMLVTVLKLLGG